MSSNTSFCPGSFNFYSLHHSTPHSRLLAHSNKKKCRTLYNLYPFFSSAPASRHRTFSLYCCSSRHSCNDAGMYPLAGQQCRLQNVSVRWQFSFPSPIFISFGFMFSGIHAINTHGNMLTSRLSEKLKIY